jgi:hypothetical protein
VSDVKMTAMRARRWAVLVLPNRNRQYSSAVTRLAIVDKQADALAGNPTEDLPSHRTKNHRHKDGIIDHRSVIRQKRKRHNRQVAFATNRH